MTDIYDSHFRRGPGYKYNVWEGVKVVKCAFVVAKYEEKYHSCSLNLIKAQACDARICN